MSFSSQMGGLPALRILFPQLEVDKKLELSKSLTQMACVLTVPLFSGEVVCGPSSWAPSCVSCPETDQAVRDHSCQRVQQPGQRLTQFSAVTYIQCVQAPSVKWLLIQTCSHFRFFTLTL